MDKEIKKDFDEGVEIAIVIGGGNIFRGISGASKGMDRVQADYMGMLATVINGLARLENATLNYDFADTGTQETRSHINRNHAQRMVMGTSRCAGHRKI